MRLPRIQFAITLLLLVNLHGAAGQGTVFTYQGRLNDTGNLANGRYDLTFALFDSSTSGNLVSGTITNLATPVSNGVFTTSLDFGSGVFTGTNYWLDIGVRTNGGSGFTGLTPRQPLTATPYAIFAGSSSNLTGTLALAQLPPGVITNNASSLVLGQANGIAPLTVPPILPASAIGSFTTGMRPFSVAVAGRYAYVTVEFSNILQIFDVSDPANPVSISSVATGTDPTSVAVAGRYAYVGCFNNFLLQIFDVSNPSAPTLTGSIGTGASFYPISVTVAGRYVYVLTQINSALQIYDVGNPSSPALVGSVGTPANPSSFTVAGRYVYVATGANNSLQIFDVSIPAFPIFVGSVGVPGGANGVAVSGRYAYVTTGANSLRIFNVGNPASPVSVGTVATVGGPAGVAVASRYAYVTTGGTNSSQTSLQVFDVNNPALPASVGSVSTFTNAVSVTVSGRYVYLTTFSVNFGSRFQIFDLGGAYIQQLEAGTIETGTLQVKDTATIGNNLDVRGGLTVSASARISGGLSVNNGGITATNFTGNGGGLTNLNPAQLTGAVPDAHLSTNVALLNTNQTFTGSNTFSSTLRVNGLMRLGSEAGTSNAPSPAGLVIRRINSSLITANSVLARTDLLTLERDGSNGGLLIRYPASTANFTINVDALSAYGSNVIKVFPLSQPLSAGTVQLFPDSQRVVHATVSFGDAYALGQFTQVIIDRFDDLISTSGKNWVGTVMSTYNQ